MLFNYIPKLVTWLYRGFEISIWRKAISRKCCQHIVEPSKRTYIYNDISYMHFRETPSHVCFLYSKYISLLHVFTNSFAWARFDSWLSSGSTGLNSEFSFSSASCHVCLTSIAGGRIIRFLSFQTASFRFEFGSPCPFPTTITITLPVPPISIWLVGWLVGWILQHINHCKLFNAQSIFRHIRSSISNNSVKHTCTI